MPAPQYPNWKLCFRLAPKPHLNQGKWSTFLLSVVLLNWGCNQHPVLPSQPASPVVAASEATKSQAPAGTLTPSPPGSELWVADPLGELEKGGVRLDQLPLPTISEALPRTPSPSETVAKVPKVPPSQNPGGESPATPPTSKSPLDASKQAPFDQETVQAGIKRSMTKLRENLQNATIYGTQYKETQAYAEEIGVLVVLVSRADNPPSWSRHAPTLRDLAIQIAQTSRDLSPDAYKKAAHDFESLEQLFQGNLPEGVSLEGKLDLPSSEFCHRLPLMRRLEMALDPLQGAVAKESEMKKNRDLLFSEAMISGLLMQVMAEPGFSSTEDPEYQAFAQSLIAAAAATQNAINEQHFTNLQSALSALRKSCNDCHQDYRFDSSQ